MTQEVKKFKSQKLSWQEWDGAVRSLATSIRNMPTRQFPKQIIGITRGGVIAAVQLTHLLEVPYAGTIHAVTYQRNAFTGGEVQQDKTTVYAAPDMSPKEVLETLFVDDIVDTGFTIENLYKKYHDAKFVAPVGRVGGINKLQNKLYQLPPIVVHDERWIEFPWESALPIPNRSLQEMRNDPGNS